MLNIEHKFRILLTVLAV